LEDRIEALCQERALISRNQLLASVGDPLTFYQTFENEHAKEELAIIDAKIRRLEQRLYEKQVAEQVAENHEYNRNVYTQGYMQKLLQERQAYTNRWLQNPYSFVGMNQRINEIDDEIQKCHSVLESAP
jgi:hypothetical protein